MSGIALAATQAAVRTAAGGSINAGIWTLVGLLVVTIGGVWIAYIKQWGPWKNSESSAREADFARLRADIDKLTARIDVQTTRIDTAEKDAATANRHAARSDAKLGSTLAACEILLGLVEREMPEAKEIPIVKRLLAQAASDDMGIGDGMRKISMMKGSGQMKTIDQLIDDVIGREGKYSNDPADRGGPTIWGITEQVARAYGYGGDMKTMSRAIAVEIYRKRYWLSVGFDKVAAIVPAVAAEMFDCGVNMGPARAGAFLQRALNLLNRGASDYPDIAADGGIGAMTIAALTGYRKVRADVEARRYCFWAIAVFRAGRYAEIAEANPSQERFEYGWFARQVRAA